MDAGDPPDMPELEEVRGRLYDREHAEMITRWVGTAMGMLVLDDVGTPARNAKRVKLATSRVAQKMNARLESDIQESDLRGALDAFPEHARDLFIETTRNVFRASAEGPLATGEILTGVVTRLAEGLEEA